jgi:hypothetical protein
LRIGFAELQLGSSFRYNEKISEVETIISIIGDQSVLDKLSKHFRCCDTLINKNNQYLLAVHGFKEMKI